MRITGCVQKIPRWEESANGRIIGRDSLQRSRAEALQRLEQIISVYQAAA